MNAVLDVIWVVSVYGVRAKKGALHPHGEKLAADFSGGPVERTHHFQFRFQLQPVSRFDFDRARAQRDHGGQSMQECIAEFRHAGFTHRTDRGHDAPATFQDLQIRASAAEFRPLLDAVRAARPARVGVAVRPGWHEHQAGGVDRQKRFPLVHFHLRGLPLAHRFDGAISGKNPSLFDDAKFTVPRS